MNVEAGRLIPPAAPGTARASRISKRILRRRVGIALITLDSLSIYLGFFIAAAGYGLLYKSQWYVMATVMLPVYLGCAANARAYAGDILGNWGPGISRAITAFALGVGVLTFIAFFLKVGDDFSRVTFAIGCGVSVVLIAVSRDAVLRYSKRLLTDNRYSIVLITDGGACEPLSQFSSVIAAEGWLDPANACPDMYGRLASALIGADRVVVACKPERRALWAHALKGANVRSEVIAPELDALHPLAVSGCGGTSTLVVADGPLNAFDSFSKRCFDLVVASGALLIMSPLLLTIALLIKIDSPGPVFFRQIRIGQGNRAFRMIKFRSMRIDVADHDASRLTTRRDPRVTRVGRFIRRTSIDELPQLLNVLAGTMSVVGPRPHALGAKAATKLYWEVDQRYWHRHAAKPGLTGLAQIRGFRGNTEQERDLTNRLHSDLEYLHGWSIWRDVMIIVRTFYVLTDKNAY